MSSSAETSRGSSEAGSSGANGATSASARRGRGDARAPDASESAGAGVHRLVTQVRSLDELVGAHPDALRSIYGSGRPADPSELGDAPRGRLLALVPGSGFAFMLVRPLIRALATDRLPWRGKTFDHGGNSGQNVLLGRRAFRFRAEGAPSRLDGRPTLVLRYDEPAFRNPWPVRAFVDELRTIAPRVAIGPAFLDGGGEPTLLLWFGLEG